LDWPTPPTPAGAPSLDWSPHVSPPAAAPVRATVPAAVVVQPGDSLWAIAADHLPPGAGNAQIAQAWPTWWSANRAAVGPNPDLIHPGLSLTPPSHH
jgi:nucleoid-associated protein YgaU